MLKLLSYSFSGIGRFVEKQTIDIENRDHLIQIDGVNNNTGGSSGAAKSTSLEALAYLLGISEIPSTNLQSRLTKSPIWVEGKFEGGITIVRDKKEGLTIITPEETISGNSKIAEEKLDQIIGINRNLLKTMCYKRQKQGGFFLNLTPKQSHDFLVECLNLKEQQDKINKLEELLKDQYKPDRIRTESTVKSDETHVVQLQELLNQKKEPEAPILQIDETLPLKAEALRQQLDSEKQKFQSMIITLGLAPNEDETPIFEKEVDLQRAIQAVSDIKQKITQNNTEKQDQISYMSVNINKLQNELQNLKNKEKTLPNYKMEMEGLQKQLKHLTEQKCPTCLRQWENQDSVLALSDLQQKINNLQSVIDDNQNQIDSIPKILEMIQKAESIFQERKQKLINVEEEKALSQAEGDVMSLLSEKQNIQSIHKQEYLKKLNSWNQSFNFIKQEYLSKTNTIETQIRDIERVIAEENLKKISYEKALESFRVDFSNIQNMLNKTKDSLSENSKKLQDLERNIILAEESIRLIKNFTLQKFQDTLDYIGHRATEIIGGIPNMSNAVIYFENAKETKTGKIKNEINAIVNLEGDSNIPIKTLSGGERTSADFAIDLAVGEMIENMTQKGVNFLIIDEGFDGLDSISKIQCLEILKHLNTDKKILIIDHSSEVKEMIRDTISIVRDGEESFVQ